MIGLDVLPLAAWSTTRRSQTTTPSSPRVEHNLEEMGSDDRRVYDMAVRRFLAVFHPEAVGSRTRASRPPVPRPRAHTSSARAESS